MLAGRETATVGHATLIARTEERFRYNCADPHVVYAWMALQETGEDRLDPQLLGRPFGVIDRYYRAAGRKVEQDHASSIWLTFELDESGFDFMDVRRGWPRQHFCEWADLALCLGIAPDQPFLVRFEATYTRDYWGEYDARFDWEVIAIEPLDPAEALHRWEGHLAYDTRVLTARAEISEMSVP